MRLEYPSIIVAMASVGSDGVAVKAKGCVTAQPGGAGTTYTVTLDQDGIAAADCVCFVTARDATTAEFAVAQTSATVKTVKALDNTGAAQDTAFDFWCLAFPKA